MAVGVPVGGGQVDVVGPCPLTHPRRAALAGQGRRGEEAGADALVVDGQLGGLDVVEQRSEWPRERADCAGDEHRSVSGGAVLAYAPHGSRRQPGEHVIGECRVDDLTEVVEPRTLVLAVDRA